MTDHIFNTFIHATRALSENKISEAECVRILKTAALIKDYGEGLIEAGQLAQELANIE